MPTLPGHGLVLISSSLVPAVERELLAFADSPLLREQPPGFGVARLRLGERGQAGIRTDEFGESFVDAAEPRSLGAPELVGRPDQPVAGPARRAVTPERGDQEFGTRTPWLGAVRTVSVGLIALDDHIEPGPRQDRRDDGGAAGGRGTIRRARSRRHQHRVLELGA